MPFSYKMATKMVIFVFILIGFIIYTYYNLRLMTKKLSKNSSMEDKMKLMKPESKMNPRVYSTTKADKWIVLTTISQPTDDVRYLSKLSGWRVVVVGDKQTPQNWTLKNCDYISVSYQNHMGFEISKQIPEISYSRKNLGYLYAIANGAKVIYDTDDDNRPLDELRQFTYTNEITGLMFNGDNRMFNPYRHFGQPSIWPRGYPLSSIGENFSSSYLLGDWRTPLIQQGLVNGDPDVDAIFRLTRKLSAKPLNIRFRSRSPPAFVPSGVYAPFNSQNTLFLYDAFWALFLPSTTSFRVCDIWRGYWAQRLMWEIGGNVGFYPHNAFSKRNQHSYLRDFEQERDLYDKAEKLITLLRTWSCEISKSFFQCVIDLTLNMIETRFLESIDGILVQSWLQDLKSLKYKEPKRYHMENQYSVATNYTANVKIKPNNSTTTKINFLSQKQMLPMMESKRYRNDRSVIVSSQLLSQCPYFYLTGRAISRLKYLPSYQNILLIINFNNPFYENIETLEMFYRFQFPYIVYCGKDIPLLHNLSIAVTFIECDTNKGFLAQICLMKAIQMNYNVEGYLFIMDDLIMNTGQLPKFSFDKIWIYQPTLKENITSEWYSYYEIVGRKNFERSLRDLKQVNRKKYYDFKRILQNNTGKADGMFHGLSDILYLPRKHAQNFLFYMEIFTRNNVFLDIAFPTIFAAIEKKDNWIYLNGKYLISNETRFHYDHYLKRDQTFLHPVKLAQLLKSWKGRKFICERIIPLLFF